MWFIWSLPIFLCSPTDQRTLTFVVVAAGKCPQDYAFTGGQCGGLQIQVSYRICATLPQDLFSGKKVLSFLNCAIVFTQWRWWMCDSLFVFQGCSFPGAAEDHPQLWHLYRDARGGSHTPPLPPWLGCRLWAVSDIFCLPVCLCVCVSAWVSDRQGRRKSNGLGRVLCPKCPSNTCVYDCEILPN